MFKVNFRLSIMIFALSFSLSSAYGQLSMFSKIDTFKGYNTQTIALDDGFLAFNNPQDYNDSIKIRITRFNECGLINWIHDYKTDSLTGNFDPDAVQVNSDVFVLLKAIKEANRPEILTLMKFNTNGNFIWAKNYYNTADKLLSCTANLLQHPVSKYLYIVSADQKGNSTVMSIDPSTGSVVNSKLIKNIKHGSSTFDQLGNLLIFSGDSLYTKLRVNTSTIDSVIWAKKIKGRFFASVNDPLKIQATTGNRVATVIIDTTLRKDTTFSQIGLDTAIYRLITFDDVGNVREQSDGFIGPDYKVLPVELKMNAGKDNNTIYVMTKNRVCAYTVDLKKINDAKYYKFQKDTFDVVDASLEILDDKSLLMSGFCYKKVGVDEYNLKNPYFFVSKTQPLEKGLVIEAEEPVCLNDSTDKTKISMVTTKYADIQLSDTLTEFTVTDQKLININVDFTKLNQEKCGKVIMQETEESNEFCPANFYPMSVEWLLWAKYKWSTGEESTSALKNAPGIYTVTVTLCDTVKTSTFEYKLTEDTDACFTIYVPEVFVPNDQTDSLNLEFKSYQKNPFAYTSYNLKVFDRWGEKVFETDDSTIGWDGNFRDSPMPAGVYLYALKWEAVFYGKTYPTDGKAIKGQVLLLR